MARLSELVTVMAKVANMSERSVRMCARHLREAGLIHQSGRGKSGAHMRPEDATNLLLGIMGSDELKDAPQSVRLARVGQFSHSDFYNESRSDKFMDDLPPWGFFKNNNGEPRTLAGVIDALIEEYVRLDDGGLFSEPHIEDFSLNVIPRRIISSIEIYNDDENWVVNYRPFDPGLMKVEIFSEEWKNMVHRIFGSSLISKTGMTTTNTIRLSEIEELAKVLRGYEPEIDGIVVPPWETEPVSGTKRKS